MLVGTAAFVYFETSRYEHLVFKREAAAARAEAAKGELEKDVAALHQQLSVLISDRDQTKSEAATLADEASNLHARLSVVETTAQQSQSQTQQELQQERSRSAALKAQLSKVQSDHAAEEEKLLEIESNRTAEEARLTQYKENLEQTATELAQFGALRNKITTRRAQLRQKLEDIWRRLSEIQLPLPGAEDGSGPAKLSTEISAAKPLDAARPAANVAPTDVTAVERVLLSAGVDVARIMAQLGTGHAEGGPFIPPPKADSAGGQGASPEKLAAIEALAKTLPISAPLASYEIGSPFGPRIDPFNHRLSFHTGIDMDAPYSSPVYATAPGRVIYAGWLGDYGRVVEIDHGFGIVTLYAHLRRSVVAPGQAVPAHTEIGLIGTTGRSTGPHVHYEVRVDGQPQDPQKFLGLARLLPAVATSQITPGVGGPAENNH
ncbi:MAG: peptidoglycan DD-metalloendopeptidase family protein [Alphaproteobacteria bacterium]|nr:peptidoglycan DD-metalloendopeptidase family protein [Alphaproteobacteria bacterium]